jgi:hypothetical protein
VDAKNLAGPLKRKTLDWNPFYKPEGTMRGKKGGVRFLRTPLSTPVHTGED